MGPHRRRPCPIRKLVSEGALIRSDWQSEPESDAVEKKCFPPSATELQILSLFIVASWQVPFASKSYLTI